MLHEENVKKATFISLQKLISKANIYWVISFEHELIMKHLCVVND